MVQSSSSVSLRDPYLIALPLRNTPREKFSVQASVSARSPTQSGPMGLFVNSEKSWPGPISVCAVKPTLVVHMPNMTMAVVDKTVQIDLGPG